MTRIARTTLCCLVLGLVAGTAAAGPLDDLMPPPLRHVEKRTLGPNDQHMRRSYYHGEGLGGAAFSPDAKSLITIGGMNGGLTVWDVESGRALGDLTQRGHHQGFAAAFTPDGKQLVLGTSDMHGGGQDHPVTLWDVARREKLRSIDDDANDMPIIALAVAPDGKTLALAGGWSHRREAPTLAFWDLKTGDEIFQIDGLIPPRMARRQTVEMFHALAFAPDGRTLAVQMDGRVALIEMATRQVRTEFSLPQSTTSIVDGPHLATPSAIAFSHDGRMLAVGCADGAVRRFDLRTSREAAPLPAHSGPILALACTPDGKWLRTYGMDGQLSVWRSDSASAWRPKQGELSKAALEALWDNLRSDDALDLFGTQELLATHPAQAVALLNEHVKPVPQADADRIEKLIHEAQKPDYNSRKRAIVELRKVGPAALPALIKSQEAGNFDQVTQRLMQQLMTQPQSPEETRVGHAVAVLERIGTVEARRLLEKLATGAAETTQTVQAKAALERLGKAEPGKVAPSPDALWDDLASEDTKAAYRALRGLAQAKAAPTIRVGFKSLVAKDTFNDDPARIAKLIADLDDENFAVRGQATENLRSLGRFVMPALQKALEGNPGAETKRRLEELLASAPRETPPAILRIGRALEALELMGGDEAAETLTALAQDNGPRWLRDAATAALRRQGR